jgi:hypothetical protein
MTHRAHHPSPRCDESSRKTAGTILLFRWIPLSRKAKRVVQQRYDGKEANREAKKLPSPKTKFFGRGSEGASKTSLTEAAGAGRGSEGASK